MILVRIAGLKQVFVPPSVLQTMPCKFRMEINHGIFDTPTLWLFETLYTGGSGSKEIAPDIFSQYHRLHDGENAGFFVIGNFELFIES